jgi:hypothetical protein
MPRRTASAGAPTPAALAHAAARLTDRDHEILAALAVVRVLTNPMTERLWFTSAITARHRMQALAAAGVVTGYRPLRAGGGSHPVHYQLTPLGAHIAATAAGSDPEPARNAAKNALERIAAGRAYLAHTTGVAWVWTGLTAAEKDERGVLRWWDNRAAAELYKARNLIPDAVGIWAEHDAEPIAWALEWDTGTERHAVIIDKINRYWEAHNRPSAYSSDEVAYALGTARPVLLIGVPSHGRERALRATIARRLAELATASAAARADYRARHEQAGGNWSSYAPEDQSRWTLPVATAVLGPETDPAGPVWHPLGADADGPLPLAELARIRFHPPATRRPKPTAADPDQAALLAEFARARELAEDELF